MESYSRQHKGNKQNNNNKGFSGRVLIKKPKIEIFLLKTKIFKILMHWIH